MHCQHSTRLSDLALFLLLLEMTTMLGVLESMTELDGHRPALVYILETQVALLT